MDSITILYIILWISLHFFNDTSLDPLPGTGSQQGFPCALSTPPSGSPVKGDPEASRHSERQR